MEIGNFAEYMFKTNKVNKIINLNLVGVENNKDLFCCFIDLFCKGLILCYGQGNTIDFDELDLEKFSYLKTKMECGGIIIKLDIIENPDPCPMTYINSVDIDNAPDNLPLESYCFKIFKENKIYHIYFSLEHRL
jgi:hypothetical protein